MIRMFLYYVVDSVAQIVHGRAVPPGYPENNEDIYTVCKV